MLYNGICKYTYKKRAGRRGSRVCTKWQDQKMEKEASHPKGGAEPAVHPCEQLTGYIQ